MTTETEKLRKTAVIDVESMLAACVPGGSVADPQAIADAIRAWVAEQPAAQEAERAAEPGKYDEVLKPFVSLMERELHANAGKGDRPGWLQMDRKTALLEIYYHLAKLQKATKGNDLNGVREYAADVANMSMMLVDVCGALPVVEQPAAGPAPDYLEMLLAANDMLRSCYQVAGRMAVQFGGENRANWNALHSQLHKILEDQHVVLRPIREAMLAAKVEG